MVIILLLSSTIAPLDGMCLTIKHACELQWDVYILLHICLDLTCSLETLGLFGYQPLLTTPKVWRATLVESNFSTTLRGSFRTAIFCGSLCCVTNQEGTFDFYGEP